MKILFDSQIFRIQKFGGVSRYCAELMNGINNLNGFEIYPKKIYSYNSHLNILGYSKYSFFKEKMRVPGKYRIENYIRKNEDRDLLKVLKELDYDIYHPTYYYPRYLDLLNTAKPLVSTIHDMTYELYYDKHFNQTHQESTSKKQLIKRSNHIIAVSQNTKNDILSLYPEVGEENISVIYHGSSLPMNLPESKIVLPAKYILYVGKRGKYKNFAWLVNSISNYMKENTIELVCAGGKPFSDDERKMIAEKDLSDVVKYYEITSDEDLATMYRKAICFVYPSSHEGFGIPILEAYSCGCPVILAKSSCFPEIGGNGALYFENGNVQQLLEQISKIHWSDACANDLKQRGFLRLQDFSWEKTVQQHIEVYKTVCERLN